MTPRTRLAHCNRAAAAGLVELKDGGTPFSDLADVDTDKSKVKVTALEAALIPTSLPGCRRCDHQQRLRARTQV